jgi:organic hydroperoxide reductase OsmC/OhrA
VNDKQTSVGGFVVPEFVFEGTAVWKSGTESDLTVKGKNIVTVSPPVEFGGKPGYCVPEEVFAAALASCMNTLYLLIASNSKLSLKNLETSARLKMNAEGLEKLIFTNIHFDMKVKLLEDNEREREKADIIYKMTQKICPIRQSWGEEVPIDFKLTFQ